MFYLEIFFAAIFGTLIGSFLNVVALRLPKRETLQGRSMCPYCKHELGAQDLIPVLSYVWLRGRCRSCKKSISPRYAIVELITALLFAGSFWLLAPHDVASWITLMVWLVTCAAGVVIFIIDFEHMLILDTVIFPVTLFVVIANVALDISRHVSLLSFSSALVSGLLGALSASLIFYAIWFFSRGRWMGFGDVKLMLFVGMVLGIKLVWVALFLSFIIGSIIGVALLLFGKKHMTSKVPYGCFMIPALLVTLIAGERLLHWYLGMIGL